MKTPTRKNNLHTPGPWELLENSGTITKDGLHIAAIFARKREKPYAPWSGKVRKTPSSEGRANARLIAASPTMAELLRRILGMHESGNCGAYNGEAILSQSVAFEIRHLLENAGAKIDNFSRAAGREVKP